MMGRASTFMLILLCASSLAQAQELSREQIQAKVDAAIVNQNGETATRGIILNNSEDYRQKLYADPAAPAASPALAAAPTSALTLHEIRFSFGSAHLQSTSFHTLSEMAAALGDQKYAQFVFIIVGHTDSRGPAPYNLRLSRMRSDSVADYLTQKGVPPERLIPVGRGSSDLADPANPTGEVNRRVEIQVARRAAP